VRKTKKILDFGGISRDAVFTAFRRVVEGRDFKISVLPVSESESLNYQEFNGSLKEALEFLVDGNNDSVKLSSGSPDSSLWLAMIYNPANTSPPSKDWSAWVEGFFDFDKLFNEILNIDGIGYIAISVDDSPEFEDIEHVTAENFPWGAWMLLVGAAKDADGKWVIRNVEEESGKK